MNLIIVHKSKNSATSGGNGLLRFAVSSEPVAGVVLDGVTQRLIDYHAELAKGGVGMITTEACSVALPGIFIRCGVYHPLSWFSYLATERINCFLLFQRLETC